METARRPCGNRTEMLCTRPPSPLGFSGTQSAGWIAAAQKAKPGPVQVITLKHVREGGIGGQHGCSPGAACLQ